MVSLAFGLALSGMTSEEGADNAMQAIEIFNRAVVKIVCMGEKRCLWGPLHDDTQLLSWRCPMLPFCTELMLAYGVRNVAHQCMQSMPHTERLHGGF